MMTNYQINQNENLPNSISRFRHWTKRNLIRWILLVDFVLLLILVGLLSGCARTASPLLQGHFEKDAQGLQVIQDKRSGYSEGALPIQMALVTSADSSQLSQGMTREGWSQFAARVKHEVQELIPVSMTEFIPLDEISSLKRVGLLNGVNGTGEKTPLEVILVVVPSSREVKGPAQFDLLPEVSLINGYQIENHATVELGFLDLKSGKLLLHSHGSSYATLEQLDVPLASNRYPRVRGSDRVKTIYPEKDQALETLRMVALNEALDQAIMKLSLQWGKG